MSAKIKAFKEKYPHIWVVSYFIIYMIWFAWLESRADEPYHVIHFSGGDRDGRESALYRCCICLAVLP